MPSDPEAGVIRFHRLSDPYGSFTNFARYPVALDGAVWPTAEHCFQAHKFTNQEYVALIRHAATPSLAARLGKSRDAPLRPGWPELRERVMRRVVRAKFIQHPSLAVKLLSTGESRLIEDTRGDHFWGDGVDGSGLNLNGRILMDIRAELWLPDDGAATVSRRLVDWAGKQPWVLWSHGVVTLPVRQAGTPTIMAAAQALSAVAEHARQFTEMAGMCYASSGRGVVLVPKGLPPTELVQAALAELDARHVWEWRHAAALAEQRERHRRD